jgi:uncharacterized protein (TIGR03067 family)
LEFRPTITESGAYGLVVQPRTTGSTQVVPPSSLDSTPSTKTLEDPSNHAAPAETLLFKENDLDGVWRVIESKFSHARSGIEKYDEFFWEFDTETNKVKTKWKVGEGTGEGESRFTVDATQTPHHLTIYGDNMLIQAVFELNGDSLKVSYFGKSQVARPKSFEDTRTDAGPRAEFFLKRVKPNEDASTPLDTENPFRVEVVPGSAANRRSGNAAETQLIESYRKGSSENSRGSSSLLPSLDVSPVEAERRLQAKLLELDVEAAATAYESAKEKMDSLSALSETGGGVVSKRTVDEARADARQKQIQLERAKTILSLFELQAKREREKADQAEKVRQMMMERSRRSRPASADEGEEATSSEPVTP